MSINCKTCRNKNCWLSGEDFSVEWCDDQVKTTNGDKIRNMTDDELAIEIGFIVQDAFCYGREMRDKMIVYPFNSHEETLAWLKAEVQ